MDLIQIAELVGAAVGGGWISHLFSVRSKVRQEKAGADKAETEVKADQIENIRKTMDEVYKPIIDDLRKTADEAMKEAAEARTRANEAMDRVEVLEKENRELRRENDQLRAAIREINPDAMPDRRGENGKAQPRGKNGQFAKKAES